MKNIKFGRKASRPTKVKTLSMEDSRFVGLTPILENMPGPKIEPASLLRLSRRGRFPKAHRFYHRLSPPMFEIDPVIIWIETRFKATHPEAVKQFIRNIRSSKAE